jgi:hypothetical protein
MEEKDEETSGGGSSGDGDGLFLRPGKRECKRRVGQVTFSLVYRCPSVRFLIARIFIVFTP